MKKCPFKHEDCTESCALYINPDDMNETVRNKLASIGVISREEGFCSLKVVALSSGRNIFENTTTNISR